MSDSEPASAVSAKDFLLRELQAEPSLSYSELRQRAVAIGLNIPPFLYGAMRRQLGLAPVVEPQAKPAEVAAELAAADDAIAGDLEADGQVSMAVAGVSSGRRSAAPQAAVEPASAVEPKPTSAPSTDGEMGTKGSGFQFAVDALRMSPDLSYQDLKLRAQMAGLPMPPIVFGRAKALLGLVPTKPRERKLDVSKAPRTLRQIDSARDLAELPKAAPLSGDVLSSLQQLQELVQTVRELEADNRHLRNALQAAYSIVTAAIEAES